MKTSHVIAALSLTAFAGTAFAQAEKKAEPAPAADKAAPAMPAPPKPDAALDQYKSMIGKWKCEGKMKMGGADIVMKATGTFSWDLDNFWVIGVFESPKVKGQPQHKGRAYYGYDAAAKQYVNIGIDNMGGLSQATSKGWEGDKQEWTGKAKMMGKEMDTKTTITRKGDKEVLIQGTMGTGAEAMTEEMTCKK